MLAPNGDDYAYVALQFLFEKPNQITVPEIDTLYVGSLSGGLREVVRPRQSTRSTTS